MPEQRRRERVKVSVASILKTGNIHFYAETGDLSESGIFLHTKRAFPAGTRLRLAFGLGSDSPNIDAEGIVKWSEPGKGFGVEWVSLSAKDKQTILQFLDSSR